MMPMRFWGGAPLAAQRLRSGLAAVAFGCVLQACASTPSRAPAPVPVTPAPAPPAPVAPAPVAAPKLQPTPGLSSRERALKILKLLNDGEPEPARAEAEELLRQEPGNTLAQSLFDQIDKDPKLLLGERNFPYRIQPGDSLSLLAQRFLGDRFLFYALARYNNLDKPGAAEVGQSILIPGVPSKTPPPRPPKSQRQESDEAAVAARLGKPATPPPAPTPAPAPQRPTRDAARASALRGQALVALNGGAADRAVSLLRQAAGLDPDNPAIKRDLARAERIQATLHR